MSTSKELREELREELAGYASPGEFDDRYVDDGVDKVELDTTFPFEVLV